MNHRKRPDTRRINRPIRAGDLLLAVEEIQRILVPFTSVLFNELERRSKEVATPDGYPAGGSSGGRSADATSSTERAVMRRMESMQADPTLMAMRAIRNDIDTAWETLIRAEDAMRYLRHGDQLRAARQTTLSSCQACERDDVPNVGNDRIRSGYCHACFIAWTRTDYGNGRQDRVAFETSRRSPESEGQDLVASSSSVTNP
jgi:hypothetical protein